ncbi:YgaP family membrane protein [Pseudalkalibacillus sp. Hm43]|uniref:YgaP family membrane protein n=1 Tax=Pseudalkalibacillus sp. Hm43 TaxID=3450742 RepID=UPI003F42C367
MKPNIGTGNALLRITIGLTMVGVATARMGRKSGENHLMMMLIGSMKVAEGITKYCPMTDLYKRGQEFNHMDLASMTKEGSPINPS